MISHLKEVLLHSNDYIIGKEDKIKLALTCILSKGHLLIEDIPGVGKTTMVKYLSKTLGLNLGRIQFTNDLLPSDILGVNIFDQEKKEFFFKKGPLFAEIILADELNRATPKTQSALLQAMEEYHITLDGNTFNLPIPFFVIATQNPNENIGTNPLPEGQMDRFLMRIQLDYPDKNAEFNLLKGSRIKDKMEFINPIMDTEKILEDQKEAVKIFCSDGIINYVLSILSYTRQSKHLLSLSPRAGLDVVRAAKAYAYLNERDHVIPEDIQYILPSVIGHRITHYQANSVGHGSKLAQEVIKSIEVF